MGEEGFSDFDKLIDNIDQLSNKGPNVVENNDSPEKDKEKQVVEPKPEIAPTLTSNEKTRARNLGLELFTGGMKPLMDIQKQNSANKKMSNAKPPTKGLNMQGFLGKLLGGIGKIFNIPMLIMSLVEAIPDIISGVFKFLMKWFLPILIGIIAFVSILKDKETWIKLR